MAGGAGVTGAAVTSPAINVQSPPAFSLAWSVPATLAYGKTFTATLTITNTGETSATTVAPTGFSVGGPTGTTCSGPLPATATIAGGGASQAYDYSCTAGGTSGSATVTAGA